MTLPETPKASPNRFWINLAIILWSIAFLYLCCRPLVQKKMDEHSVYHVFTSAAQNWMQGADLYTVGSTEEFRYSPLIATFFVPFQLMPARLGQFLWRSLNFCTYLIGLLYFLKLGLPKKLRLNQQAAILLLVLPLSIGSLNNAQSNPLVIGMMLIAVGAILQNKWTLSAIAIVLATLFKLYPVVLGLLFILEFPKRFIWRFIVCLAVGALLPFTLQHADYVIHQYMLWTRYLTTEDRQRGPIADWYRDFRAVWRIYISPMTVNTYLIVEIASGAIIAIVCAVGRLKNWPRPVLLTFTLALACCWMTALGPATESATYILLAPSLVFAVVEADTKTFRISYGMVFGLFIISQLAINIPHGRWFRDFLQPLPIAGLLFLIILLADTLRQRPRPTSNNV
jgi:hypothetical protein